MKTFMETAAHAFTPQEKRILNKKKMEVPNKRKRVFRMLSKMRETLPRLSIERAHLFTKSFRETEGKPLILRWAMALKYIAENVPLYIGEDELIVGRGCGYPGRYALMFPELEGGRLAQLGAVSATRPGSSYNVTEEDAKIMNEEILPYWEGKSYHEALYYALPADTRRMMFDPDNKFDQRVVLFESASDRHSQQWVIDYNKVLIKGFKEMKREVTERLAGLDEFNAHDTIDKRPFLEAAILATEAATVLAKRYAKYAMQIAKTETSSKRKRELLKISQVCERVSEHPPETFHEAVQAQWFTQLLSRFEQKTGGVVGNGRMDQYLYPFYKADIEKGRITEETALELLENLWLCMANYIELLFGPHGGSFTEGYAHWEALTIGGRTEDGRDATNELSYLILKSKRELPLSYPDLAARIHSQTPERFLFEVCETIKEGSGFPKLFNDEEIYPFLLSKGATIGEANDYCLSGCTEARLVNRDTYFRGGSWINLPAVLEMALNDGKVKYYNERIGLPTGDARSFVNYGEVYSAFRIQFENVLKHLFITQHVADKIAPSYLAAPQISMLNDTCMRECRDIQTGFVPGGIHRAEFDITGYSTTADSLASIKKLVFDDQKITIHELLDALDQNFEGKEAIRQMCLNAPKFGNNDPYVDAIARNVEEIAAAFCHRYPLYNGGSMHVRYVPITSHIAMGKCVGATPNGRRAGEFLSDGASPSQGGCYQGPGAVLLSSAASKVANYHERAARLLNLKLTPSSVEGSAGTKKLMSFVRSWVDLKLWHIQFNVINRETLIQAQKDPEKYRDLIVRVAGYSAYFVDLSPALQQEIIARSDLEL